MDDGLDFCGGCGKRAKLLPGQQLCARCRDRGDTVVGAPLETAEDVLGFLAGFKSEIERSIPINRGGRQVELRAVVSSLDSLYEGIRERMKQ